MSFPTVPNVNPDIEINPEDVKNLLLASIAFEELGLAHLINAEAEKIQFVLGTLPNQVTTDSPTIDDLLAINRSVERILRDVIKKEMLLEFKLENILDLTPCTPVTATFTNPTPIIINGDAAGPADPYPSSINVAGLTGSIAKVTVTLSNMSHAFPSDLDILLVGPQGNIILMSDAGGGTDIANVTLTFDDAAPTFVPTPIVSGTFRPTDVDGGDGDAFPAPAPPPPYGFSFASSFNGTNPNGIWSLFVFDDAPQDSGSIDGGWSLTITTACP